MMDSLKKNKDLLGEVILFPAILQEVVPFEMAMSFI
jgi:hypothetical protein